MKLITNLFQHGYLLLLDFQMNTEIVKNEKKSIHKNIYPFIIDNRAAQWLDQDEWRIIIWEQFFCFSYFFSTLYELI